jgi:ABC-type lipoprotein release transport system permease subunit
MKTYEHRSKKERNKISFTFSILTIMIILVVAYLIILFFDMSGIPALLLTAFSGHLTYQVLRIGFIYRNNDAPLTILINQTHPITTKFIVWASQLLAPKWTSLKKPK